MCTWQEQELYNSTIQLVSGFMKVEQEELMCVCVYVRALRAVAVHTYVWL